MFLCPKYRGKTLLKAAQTLFLDTILIIKVVRIKNRFKQNVPIQSHKLVPLARFCCKNHIFKKLLPNYHKAKLQGCFQEYSKQEIDKVKCNPVAMAIKTKPKYLIQSKGSGRTDYGKSILDYLLLCRDEIIEM